MDKLIAISIPDASELELARAGSAADSAAARSFFADYCSRKAPSTRAAHDDDLAAFARYLADAGVQGLGACGLGRTIWQTIRTHCVA